MLTTVEQNIARRCDRPSCRWCHVTRTATRTRATRYALLCRCPTTCTSTTLRLPASVHCITLSWRQWSSLTICYVPHVENGRIRSIVSSLNR